MLFQGDVTDCGYCEKSVWTEFHPPQLMVDESPRPRYDTWWQSVTWREFPVPLRINITASFNKSYELQSDVKITFKSPRPERMVLEKSVDFGDTWRVWQYYDVNCSDYVSRGIAVKRVTVEDPQAVVCQQVRFTHSHLIFSGDIL